MPNFSIVKKFDAANSFRNASIIGKFDLQSNHIEEHFEGNIKLPDDWNIGLITGNSGTGKTVIAKELFGDNYTTHFNFSEDKSILDDMPGNVSVEEISKALNSVGFSSPTQWIKPYKLLSDGQRMRVDLARSLLSEKEMIVFDEFTSVIDRNVAKIGSLAVQKTIRRTNRKFIAVSCHNDIEEWLQPDWVFDTNLMEFRLSKKKDLTLNLKSLKQKTKQFGECLQSIII